MGRVVRGFRGVGRAVMTCRSLVRVPKSSYRLLPVILLATRNRSNVLVNQIKASS